MERRQLMHEYVQKSNTTTLPRRPARVSGFELSQPVAPLSSGICPSITASPVECLLDIIAPDDMTAPSPAGFALIIAPAGAFILSRAGRRVVPGSVCLGHRLVGPALAE
jgi:hypothetical protein